MKNLSTSVAAEIKAAEEKNQVVISGRDYTTAIIVSVVLSIAGLITGAVLIFGVNVN